jgi:hypothetical protein
LSSPSTKTDVDGVKNPKATQQCLPLRSSTFVPHTVAHTCNPSTWEAKAGGLRVQGQSEQHSKMLSQGKKKERKSQEKGVKKECGGIIIC